MRPRFIKEIKEPDLLPVQECLAKTRQFFADGKLFTEKGCNIYTHLWTTCMILRELKNIWEGYPKSHLILPHAEWLATFHDIGKVTPGFIGKLYKNLGLNPPWENEFTEPAGGHAHASNIILEKEYGEKFALLAGSHHGISAQKLQIGDSLQNENMGGAKWQDLRQSLLKKLQKDLQLCECDLKHLPEEKMPIILGAVILADWLSSGMDLSFTAPLPDQKELRKVIFEAGFQPPNWKKGYNFSSLFGFEPNELQKSCSDLGKPGSIYIIESGMGSGKTEAALYLAYQLLENQQADGLYFAMPTKLTSEKIYDRLNQFLAKAVQNPEEVESLLIHGEAWLEKELSQPDENGTLLKNPDSWFQTPKRALLAPFAAGTVDQALLAVINVRHKALRAFALSGKVVILDEVHSYDNYTGSLVAELVQKIRDWGGTVIILSATLTAETRKKLLGIPDLADGEKLQEAEKPYPLISLRTPDTDQIREIPFAADPPSRVELRSTSEELAALSEALNHAENGEQVLWITNTVATSQDIYRKLQTVATGIEVGLIHSRFPVFQRRKNEEYWVDLLGKNGQDKRCKKGRILVATQILEQSVDVDADFMISQLAPADMLFQRLGRLWRHRKFDKIRPSSAVRQALILYPEECNDPLKILHSPLNLNPYDPYWMLRTFQVWKKHDHVILPNDIRPMLEEVYQDREDEEAMLSLKQDMEKKKDYMERMADLSQAECNSNDLLHEDKVATRLSEQEEVQLLLLQKGNRGLASDQYLFPFFADTPIELPAPSASKKKRNKTAAQLLQFMLKVPAKYAPDYAAFPLPMLQHILWTGDQTHRPLRAAYVDESGLLLDQSNLPISQKHLIYYHNNLGFYVRKKED